MNKFICFAALALCISISLSAWAQPAPSQSMKEYRVSLAGGNPILAQKLSSELLSLRSAAAGGKSAVPAAEKIAPHAVRQGKIQCIIGAGAEIGDDFETACKSAGLTMVGIYNNNKIGLYNAVVQCTNPLQLDSIALRDDVRLVRLEPRARTWAGSVDNQADVSINADDARTNFSVDGTGVRVGVLSDSFHRTSSVGGVISSGFLTGSIPQGTGDLPASIRIIDPGPSSSVIDEGAGMAELIYDLAPGCDISFASAFTSYPAFAANITALRTDETAPADVIVDDVIWFGEPVYQDGPIAVAASESGLAGVPFFSSAGNSAAEAHESDYVDVNPGTDDTLATPSGNDFHDFGAAKSASSDTHLTLSLPNNGDVTVSLHWDEPYGGGLAPGPGSEADLDLYLVSDTSTPLSGNILEFSTDPQGTEGSPQGDAVEEITYVNETGSVQTVHIVIDHVDGREPVKIHLGVFTSGTIIDSALLGDRTVYGHAAADNVQAVAAMFYGEIDLSGNVDAPAGQLDVEPFSSLGDLNHPIWFSADGNTRYGTAQTRLKPEITAPDGTNTTFFGQTIAFDGDSNPNFFGTSAAAPHAAAVAALMLEYNPTLSSADVYSALEASAIDAESAGLDALSGHGLIDANLALTAAPGLTSAKEWPLYY